MESSPLSYTNGTYSSLTRFKARDTGLASLLQQNFNLLPNQKEKILKRPTVPRPNTEERPFRGKPWRLPSQSQAKQQQECKIVPAKRSATNDRDPNTKDLSNKLATFIENVIRQRAVRENTEKKQPLYRVMPLPPLQKDLAPSKGRIEKDKAYGQYNALPKNRSEPPFRIVRSKIDPKGETEKKLVGTQERRNTNPLLAKDEIGGKLVASIEEYSLGNQIGQGAYAVVRSGIHTKTNQKVAIKIYEKFKLISSQRRNCVNREITLLKRLTHPNIIKLYETINTPRQLYLIMELVRGRSLLHYLKTKSGRKLAEPEAIKIFKQVLHGINYCHSQNVAHRDIKLENILLDENLNPKIIDFGFSVYAPPTHKLKIFCGTPSYMSPEIVNKKEYIGPPTDMWSLGVLLYVMLCGSFPFRGATELELYRNIGKGLFSIPSFVSSSLNHVISRLLSLDPHRRPTSAELSKNALFAVAELEKNNKAPFLDTVIGFKQLM